MQFDFLGMQAMYLSLARGEAGPIAEALLARPALDITSQWANFVRNHDELTLDKLSDDERQEVFDAFGPEPEMQLYGRGLRRRLPSMLGGDERRMRMVYSLMFSLPGENWLRLLIWLALGLAVYFAYGRHHSVMARPADPAMVGEPLPGPLAD